MMKISYRALPETGRSPGPPQLVRGYLRRPDWRRSEGFNRAIEIEQKIHETAAGLNEERQYLELAQRRGLPHDPLARNQMIESHHKIIANLEKDMEDLLAARAKRQLA
jgi:hypothetical protein